MERKVSSHSQLSMPKRKRSDAWTYFEEYPEKAAKCEICGIIVKLCGNSTNLKSHLKRHHPEHYTQLEDDRELQNEKNQKHQRVLHEFISKNQRSNQIKHYPSNSARCKEIDEALVTLICDNFLPFKLVESKSFKKFVSILDNKYMLPARKQLSTTYLDLHYEKRCEVVQNQLSEAEAVHLTTDLWTDTINQISYITVTAHMIDKTCQLYSLTLETSYIEGKHTAENIYTSILSCISKWKLANKVNTIITDNGANMIAAIKRGMWTSLPCFAHTLNLVVTDALKNVHLSDSVDKFRKIVHIFKSSPSRNSVLLNKMKAQGIQSTLKRDICTRWNSLLIMLKSIMNLRDILPVVLTMIDKKNDEDIPIPTAEDWLHIKTIIEVLAPFEEITTALSGANYVTASKVIPLTKCLKTELQIKHFQDPVANSLRNSLLAGLETRMGKQEQNGILVRATLLDPRYKHLLISELTFNNYKNRIITEIEQYCRETILEDSNVTELNSENDCDDETIPNDFSGGDGELEKSSFWNFLDNKAKYSKKAQKSIAAEEVENYFSDKVIPRNSDPLKWWESVGRLKYPCMVNTVKKYLAVPATSVPSERVFSQTGQLIDTKRNKINPRKTDKIIFIKMNN